MKRIVCLIIVSVILSAFSSVRDVAPVQAQPVAYDGMDIVFLVDQSGSMSRLNGSQPPNDRLGLRFESFPLIASILGEYRLAIKDQLSPTNQLSFRIAIVNYGDRSEIWQFSLSGSVWQTIEPTSRDEWNAQYKQLEQDFQRMKAEFSRRDLGNTNFLGAFERANELFRQLPDLPGQRQRYIIVLTDGQPYQDTPGFTVGGHMESLRTYVQQNFPEPDYLIYVLAMSDASASYWERIESYWNRITNDPCTARSCPDRTQDRASLITDNDTVGKRFYELLQPLVDRFRASDVNIQNTDITPGFVTVPPYLKYVVFTYFKTNPTHSLVVTDPQGTVDETRAGVEVEGEDSSIQVIRVFNPVPGRWQITTIPPNARDVGITMRSIFARSQLISPSAAQVQLVPVSIQYVLLDDGGQPLPVYSDPTYRLNVVARVKASDQSWDLKLNSDGQGTYLAEFIPTMIGSHVIEVQAESQDFDGKKIVLYSGEIGSFSVSPIRVVAKDVPDKWYQYHTQPITFQFQDEGGTPVRAPASVQLNITVDGEALNVSPVADSTFQVSYTPQRAGKQILHASVVASDSEGNPYTLLDDDIATLDVLPTVRVDIEVVEPTQSEQLDTGLLPWERNPLRLRVRLQDENGNPLDPQTVVDPDQASNPFKIRGQNQQTGEPLSIPLTFRATGSPGEFIAQTTDLGIGEYTFAIEGAPLNDGYLYRVPTVSVNVVRIRHPWHLPLLGLGVGLVVAMAASGIIWVVRRNNLRKHPCRGNLVIADADGIPKFRRNLDRYGRNRIIISGKEFPAILQIRKMEIWCESEADSRDKKVYVRVWRQGDRVPLVGLDGKLLSPRSEVRLGGSSFWLYKDYDDVDIPSHFG